MQFHANPANRHLPFVAINSSADLPNSFLPASSSNASSDSTTADPIRTTLSRDEDLAKVEIAVLGAIFVLALAGNVTVLYVLLSIARHKKLSRMNAMIIHLTVADLFVGFFHVLPQLAWKGTFHFRGGRFLCKLVTYGQLVAMFAASYVLVTTAIDRYLAICHPLQAHSWGRRRMRCLVGAAWVVSFVFAVPQLFIFSYGPHPSAPHISDCNGAFEPSWTLSVYVTWVTLSIYLLPLVILVVLYTRICLTVWRSAGLKETTDHRRRAHRESPPPPPSPTLPPPTAEQRSKGPRVHVRIVSQAKVKTVKLTLVVIANSIACYGPFFVSQMWAAWDETAPFEGKAMVIIMLLASLTSCTNPWIYMAFNDRFSVVLSNCFHLQRHRSTGTTSATDSTICTKSTNAQLLGPLRQPRTHSTALDRLSNITETDDLPASPTVTTASLRGVDGLANCGSIHGNGEYSPEETTRVDNRESDTKF